MTENPAAFKHNVNDEVVRTLARQLSGAYPEFDVAAFETAATTGLLDLELKDRVRHIIAGMRPLLPASPARAVDIARRAALGHFAGGAKVSGWATWPIIDFVGAHGVGCFDDALEALRQMTSLWSAEFAIRPFYRHDAARALATVGPWVNDPSEHVRRLVSEGSRPRLPWGARLRAFQADPAPVLALLEALRDDPSEYVRRSVANNLNDIAKDHPDVVCLVCARWLEDAPTPRRKLVQHALRSLVKAGSPAALEALGFRPDPPVVVQHLSVVPDDVAVGGSVEIEFELVSRSDRAERLVVDYAVHHVKANGSRSPKVFKLKTVELAPGQALHLRKKHSLKKVTTRVYHPGPHTVEILVNGAAHQSADFELRI